HEIRHTVGVAKYLERLGFSADEAQYPFRGLAAATADYQSLRFVAQISEALHHKLGRTDSQRSGREEQRWTSGMQSKIESSGCPVDRISELRINRNSRNRDPLRRQPPHFPMRLRFFNSYKVPTKNP